MKYNASYALSIFIAVVYLITIGNGAFASDANASKTEEHLLLTTDKSYYLAGEDINFSVFLKGAAQQASQLAHIVLLDNSGKEIIKEKLPFYNYTANGVFKIPGALASGKYSLICFTKVMLAYSDKNYVQSEVVIVNPSNFNNLTDIEQANIQLFPELGHIETGINNTIYFKFFDKEADIVQAYLFSRNSADTLASLNSLYQNTGKFNFFANDSLVYYIQLITKEDTFEQELPAAISAPYLKLINSKNNELRISAFAGVQYPSDSVRLRLWHENTLAVQFNLKLNREHESTIMLPKKYLANGLNYFQLIDEANNPIASNCFSKINVSKPTELVIKDTAFKVNALVALPIVFENAANQNADGINFSVSIRKSDFQKRNIWKDEKFMDWIYVKGAISLNKEFKEHLQNNHPISDLMPHTNFTTFDKKYESIQLNTVNRVTPEKKDVLTLKGELIDPASGKPIANELIFIAVLSEYPQLMINSTDENGFYEIFFRNPENKVNVIIKPLEHAFPKISHTSKDAYDYEFVPLDAKKSISSDRLHEFVQYKVENRIIERNYNQQRTIPNKEEVIKKTRFFDDYNFTIDLKEYTVLSDFEEVVKELLTGAITRQKDGKKHIYLRKINPVKGYYYDRYDMPPLVLVNGIPLLSDEKLYDLEVSKISSVNIKNELVGIADQVFNGVIEVVTEEDLSSSWWNQESFIIQTSEKFSTALNVNRNRQNKSSDRSINTPSFEEVLYWNPSLKLKPNDTHPIKFSTNDGVGEYLVELIGVDSKDRIYIYRKIITVTQ